MYKEKIIMSKNIPSPDTKNFYAELVQNAPVENLHFKKWDKVNGFPFTPPAGLENVESLVVAPSGYYPSDANPSSPEPSGQIILVKYFRNHEADGHLNVDNSLHWQDSEGRPWTQHFIDADEHMQDYLQGTKLGNIADYKGYPSTDEGTLEEYEKEAKLGHAKSLPPYR